jgi:N-glycosylase/DNA lyase
VKGSRTCGVAGAFSPANDTSYEQVSAPCFNLDSTLDSGQVFHWTRHGKGYMGTIGETPAYVEQREDCLLTYPGLEDLIKHYFALDHDLPGIVRSFPHDPLMKDAAQFCAGLRILRQPPWECVATFITSALKQVPHIRQISLTLRARFGRPVGDPSWRLFAYPTPEALADAGEMKLRKCALGFRARNLAGAARMVAAGEVDLEAIRKFPDDEARAALCRLPGVGPKVANCILLFAYERLASFPIDTWIARVLTLVYLRRKRKLTPDRMRTFAREYFGPFGGYAQQYLFHYARKTWRKGALPETYDR